MFREHFDFTAPMLVNFVGGGGKTGLILKLSEEYTEVGTVLYTTTTRIHPPPPSPGRALLSCSDLSLLEQLVHRGASVMQHRVLVVTRPEFRPGLLAGVPPDFAVRLDRSVFRIIFNEADGARSVSLKLPRQGEPVLMEDAQFLVPVIGLDCLLRPLGPDTLFRWESASRKLGFELGQKLTPALAASVLLHPEGVCRDWRAGTRIIPFINKVDSHREEPLARELAGALLAQGAYPVERVVWGSLMAPRCQSVTP